MCILNAALAACSPRWLQGGAGYTTFVVQEFWVISARNFLNSKFIKQVRRTCDVLWGAQHMNTRTVLVFNPTDSHSLRV